MEKQKTIKEDSGMRALPFIEYSGNLYLNLKEHLFVRKFGFTEELYSKPFSPDMLNPESPECLFDKITFVNESPRNVEFDSENDFGIIEIRQTHVWIRRLTGEEIEKFQWKFLPFTTIDDLILKTGACGLSLQWNERAIKILKGGGS